jgi:hypothetical protein
MSDFPSRSAERVVLAILHSVGQDTLLTDNRIMARIFNDAARNHASLLGRFAWHPIYHVSDILAAAFQILDQTGSITRENAAQVYFRVSPHAAGAFGRQVLEQFTDEEQLTLRSIADEIQREFGDAREPAGAN